MYVQANEAWLPGCQRPLVSWDFGMEDVNIRFMTAGLTVQTMFDDLDPHVDPWAIVGESSSQCSQGLVVLSRMHGSAS